MTLSDSPGAESGPKDLVLTGMRQIAAGGMIGFAGILCSVALNFLHQFLLARMLTPGDVGLYNLGMAISALIALVVILGTDRAIVRLVAKYSIAGETNKENGAIYGVFVIVGILIVLVIPILYFQAERISTVLFGKPELTPTLELLIISIPFTILVRLAMGVFQAYKHIRVIAVIEQMTIPALRVFFLGAAVVLIGFTGAAAAYSFLFASIAGCFLTVWLLLPFLRERKGKDAPVFSLPIVFTATIPFFFVTLLNRTNSLTETLVIGALSTNDQVGLYTLGLKITATIAIFLEAFSIIFAPFIAELYSKRDFGQLSAQLKTITYWVFTLTLPFAAILFIEAADIMAIIGPEYEGGAPVLQILAVAQFVYAIIGISSLILVMTDRNRLNMIDLVISIILSLVLDFSLIPAYGAVGAAAAGAMTIFIVNVLRLAQVYGVFRMTPFSLQLLKPLIAGVVASGVCFWVAQYGTIASPMWRLIFYGGVLLALYAPVVLIAAWFDGSLNFVLRAAFQKSK